MGGPYFFHVKGSAVFRRQASPLRLLRRNTAPDMQAEVLLDVVLKSRGLEFRDVVFWA